MKRLACPLCETVRYSTNDQLLVLNSAADPLVQHVVERLSASPDDGHITLAEDNVALAKALLPQPDPPDLQPSQSPLPPSIIHHVAFHNYIAHARAETIDVAVMNLLYQPGNSWMYYGLQVAAHALKVGGYFYVVGAKERGILSLARHIEELFGNVETLLISKGQRVLLARKKVPMNVEAAKTQVLGVFSHNKLDEGTRLLLDALEVQATDHALDIGCGNGLIGLHMARLARKGRVIMVDVSLAAVDATQQAIRQSSLTNVRVLPSDGTQAVFNQRFDLIATNPPLHQGGIQTTTIAERFIREAAQALHPQGRFYLVANRFLKYEYRLQACFHSVAEVGGNTRYKVLRALNPL